MIHLIGYGNPGRGDDGLGPALADRIAARDLPGVTVHVDFQLSVDHALLIRDAAGVVFADASLREGVAFHAGPARPDPDQDLTSHSLSPGAVLALCRTLFGATPPAIVLGIGGVAFGHMEDGLSARARTHLDLAARWLCGWLADPAYGVDVTLPARGVSTA